MFLDLNDVSWDPDPPQVEDAETAMLAIAAAEINEAAVADWLRDRTLSPAKSDSLLGDLTPEQIELLPADQRTAFDELRAMSPDERARFVGHLSLVRSAWNFLEPAVRDGDLRAAWSSVDPVLRRCLAQQWLRDNDLDHAAVGFNAEDVAEALAEVEPNHVLWRDFQRVHVRSLRQVMPSPEVWGIGANTRLVGPDLEVLYLHDMTTNMPDGLWEPNEARNVYPLLMRWDGAQWLVLNLGSEAQPRPGWPPTWA